jgi:hypothetical protein
MSGLPTDVAAKYDLAKDFPLKGGHPKFGVIDLTQIDVEGADNLVSGGFEGLVLKKTKAQKPETKEA